MNSTTSVQSIQMVRDHLYRVHFLRTPVKCRYITVIVILDFYCRLDILFPREIKAKTKQCCKLLCYVRSQAYCYVLSLRPRTPQISRSPKDSRASLGESLNVCTSARIPLQLSQLTFINVCGGT